MVTASQRLQDTCKVLAGTDTLLTHPLRGDAQSRASILQAFLRTDRDISLRPWGRRCLADHHLRTWCPPNKPPRASSGSGGLPLLPQPLRHAAMMRTGALARAAEAECPVSAVGCSARGRLAIRSPRGRWDPLALGIDVAAPL